MWGLQSQLDVVRERMKLLLEAHGNEITTTDYVAQEGDLLLEQGETANQILLLNKGSVAIQLRQNHGTPHTLTVIEAEEILGEMGLFGNGVHSADVRVVGGPAHLTVIDGNQMLQAMLFDTDLSMEILALIAQRCLRSNQMMGLLLDGIAAAHTQDAAALEQCCQALRQLSHSMETAADRLASLGR